MTVTNWWGVAMTIEKHTFLLPLFTGMVAMMNFLVAHDPYAERSRNEFMNLIFPFANDLPFFN